MKKGNVTQIIKSDEVDEKIIHLRQQDVILDIDIAVLYGVQTRDINKAVKNNPDKFPNGYIFEVTKKEFEDMRWKISTGSNTAPGNKKEPVEIFHRFENLKHSTVNPKAFTEKGLYMLATILKSNRATQTTLAIIETYSRLKNLSRNINSIAKVVDEKHKQDILRKSGEIITEIFSDDLTANESETSIELNFAVLKFKHTIKKKKQNK